MGFADAVRSCFSQYVTFSGRARRAEYWWFALFSLIGNAITGILDAALFGTVVIETTDAVTLVQNNVLNAIFSLIIFLPSISVTVRRLHDTDRSGWWFWIILIPFIGWIVLLYWMIKRGDAVTNSYGPDPIDDAGIGISGIPRVPRS